MASPFKESHSCVPKLHPLCLISGRGWLLSSNPSCETHVGKRQNDEGSMDCCELSSCSEKVRMGSCEGKGLSFIAVVHMIALWVGSLKYAPQGAGEMAP